MERTSLVLQRLHNQYLTRGLPNPVEVVRWLGAVQAQDYAGGKWAIAQRARGPLTDQDLDRALDQGKILRTHVLRPTWHFVGPGDIRWMLKLTSRRIHTLNATYYRKVGLDEKILKRSYEVIAKKLQGGQQLTRRELAEALQGAGIKSDNLLTYTYILFYAEVEGLICSGAKRGKQHTHALIDEWVPPTKMLGHEESIAELAKRYFLSRGPATLKDYVWWSGLSAADARAGLELVKSQLVCNTVDGQMYWGPDQGAARRHSPVVHLLPNYDEFIVAYADRSAVFDQSVIKQVDSRNNILFNNTIIIDGRALGTWKRTLKKQTVTVETTLFVKPSGAQQQVLEAAVKRYGEFLGTAVEIEAIAIK